MTDRPQIYLVTPPAIDADFGGRLSATLDAAPVACLRLDLATRDEDTLLRAADALRAVTEPRDVALVIADHVALSQRAGLDGVHLRDGARNVRHARAELGPDAIVGAFCGTSRHDGMNAGEAGADYIAFGPVGGAAPGDGTLADRDLFAWWSEMIELPVVAEGGFDAALLAALAPFADFIALGEEVWLSPDPAARLAELNRALDQT
ncbi:thiamine-phosphate pyrophosphorylase, putative [Oceaniovalibus guishaninsula JLT2003]|uniref:Thiamine-phosphate pyrophosphorylase, putative n=1 Tax=Oceaniovalibus guishaninsula JLT2003 TaxID=1231392 RepID=K2HLA9_9RHOB|nr:thiamine phosphate synthase [Oceaniovalibus guishaninsula]EKE43639.1 thiamine-phosphate pyrophosphorylase, putative [Oceaniovalibus guishaninsula JLT2003]